MKESRKDGRSDPVVSTEPSRGRQERIADLIEASIGREWGLIPLLQAIQAAVGYIPAECIGSVADALGLFPAQVHGVITFYSRFTTEPGGRVHVRVCRGLSCHVRGGRQVLRAVRQELGIREGGSTPDGAFSLESASCLGTCLHSPAMTVGRDSHGLLTRRKIPVVMKKYRGGKTS